LLKNVFFYKNLHIKYKKCIFANENLIANVTMKTTIYMADNANKQPLPDEDGIEIEQIDDSTALMSKPFDPTKINIETQTPSLYILIKRIERKSIQLNYASYFHRKDGLWDDTKQSRLIESILIRFPLSGFFFDATDDNNWLVVDGLQRLSSIRNFCVLKTLRLTNLEFLTQLNGYNWDDLGTNNFEDLQRVIEETQVQIHKILPGTFMDVKFNIFKRINTGGSALQPQEIRHALLQGKPADFIAKLSTNEAFIKATGGRISPRRMLDRDIVNRFLSFYLFGYKDYTSDLDTFMTKAMASINQKTEAECTKIEADFIAAMNLSHDIFGKQAFRKLKKGSPVNKALFDAIAAQLGWLTKEESDRLKQHKNQFKQGLKNILDNDSYFLTAITSSTGDKNKVTHRHKCIELLIKSIIHP
jgi:Protein of unknown function DUF262